MERKSFEVLVIGGGLNGLSTLYHLARLGVKRLGLVEQFYLGHDRGSSHGTARITRSTYPHKDYVHLMQLVHREEWPRLEEDATCKLIYPVPGCFFGPADSMNFERYVTSVQECGANVEWLSSTEGSQCFPQFRFNSVLGGGGILYDKTAGIVAATKTLQSLCKICVQRGVQIYEKTLVSKIDLSSRPIRVETSQGILEAERVVVTAGAWASKLLPFLNPRLQVVRQVVGYFRPPPFKEKKMHPFPVWGFIGDKKNDFYYGMPPFPYEKGGRGVDGFKVAQHLTTPFGDGCNNSNDNHRGSTHSDGRRGYSQGDDPNKLLKEKETSLRLENLLNFVRTCFIDGEHWKLQSMEQCLYTNTESEDFILDLCPENPHVVIGAGFSGHGFKWGPFTGRVLAELALSSRGVTTIPQFEKIRKRFRISNY